MAGETGAPPSAIREEHFRLLREYGRSPIVEKMSTKEREVFWATLCNSAMLPPVDHKLVVEEWKRYITGTSNESGVALNNDIDPTMCAIGVSYRKKLTASHTTRTTSLLDRLIALYAKCFPNREAFLDDMQKRTTKIANKFFGKPS